MRVLGSSADSEFGRGADSVALGDARAARLQSRPNDSDDARRPVSTLSTA